MSKEFAVEYFRASEEHYDVYYSYKLNSILRICSDSIQLIYTSNSLVRSNSFLSVVSIDGTKEYLSFTIDEGGDHDGSYAVSRSTSYEILKNGVVEIIHSEESVKDKSKIEKGSERLIEPGSYWDLETEVTYKYEYLIIDNCSIKRLSTKKNIHPDRNVPIASEKLLASNDLTELSQKELRLMRNEVFAAYGYKFKSQDLSKYFGEQSWYNPEYDDVTDQLSDIEKLNVQRIIEYEKKATNSRSHE